MLIYVEVHMILGGGCGYACVYVGRPKVDMGCFVLLVSLFVF